MSFFDDSFYGMQQSSETGCFPGVTDQESKSLLSVDMNWTSIPGSTGVNEDNLETPRQENFPQSLLSQKLSPAAMQSTLLSDGRPRTPSQHSSQTGSEEVSISPSDLTADPDLSFESQLISGPFVSESKSGSSSSSTSSELSDYFHHAQEYRNPNLVYKKSLHKSSRRTDPVKQEKYIFNFEESAQSSNKFSAPVPGLPESPEKKPLTLTTTPDALFPSIEALMDPIKHGVDMGTLFSSLEEASAAAIKTSNVPPDPTLPCTLQQKKAIVKALFNAINSIDHAEDNPGMIRPFAEKKYEPVRIENACWQILEACMSRQTTGPLLKLCNAKAKQTGETMNFADRLAIILECLITQKTICKHLLDPIYLYNFVDDPAGARKRVIANKTLNKRKGEVMNAGKQVLAGGVKNRNTTDTVESEQLEDPFSNSAPPSSAPGSRNNRDADPKVTPSTFNQHAMKALRLGSSPLRSPPNKQSLRSQSQEDTLRQTSFSASQNPVHESGGTNSYNSSPALGYNHMAFMPHLLARQYTNRIDNGNVTGTSAPVIHHQLGSSFMARSHVRTGSLASVTSSASRATTPGSLYDPRLQGEMNIMLHPQTPTKGPRTVTSRSSSSHRKRSSAEVESMEYSPEKRLQH